VAPAQGRAVGARPDAAPVGRDHEQAAVATEHAPNLAQHVALIFAAFDAMREQHQIHRRVGQGQVRLVHERGIAGPFGRPMQHPLRGGHEGDDPLRLVQERAQVGRGVAEAEHAPPAHVGPQGAHLAAHHAPGGLAELAFVKVPEIDDIVPHDGPEISTVGLMIVSAAALFPAPRGG